VHMRLAKLVTPISKKLGLRVINYKNWEFMSDSPHFRAGSRWGGSK
jgi:hypothetical protein